MSGIDQKCESIAQAGTPETAKAEFLLCVPTGWDLYISCEFHELHQGLIALGWRVLVVDDVSDDVILESIRCARVVLLWEAYELLERNETALCDSVFFREKNIKRVFFCDDVHFFTTHRHQQRSRAFAWADLILATYPDKLHQWYPEIDRCKVRWSPHAAASHFQPTFSPSRDHVLLSGSRTWPYPFRQFCHVKLPPSICQTIDHPGYPGYPGDKTNQCQADPMAMSRSGREHYALVLRTYPAMLVCGSIFGYLVAKVFEGMAAGCLVICDRASLATQLTALGFVEGQHYIGTDVLHVIEDSTKVRNAFVRGDPVWKEIVTRAADKVSARHTTAVRASQIHQFCTEETKL